MPVRSRRPEDEKPLFRALNDQRLVGPVGTEQNGAPQAEGAQGGPGAGTTAGQAPSSQAGQAPQANQGPVSRVLDRAQENNWVYDSVANTLREKGLAAKADQLLSRLTGR